MARENKLLEAAAIKEPAVHVGEGSDEHEEDDEDEESDEDEEEDDEEEEEP